jgi:hypothetical protein
MIIDSLIRTNKIESDKHAKAIEDFIARGGKVQVIENGISGEKEYKNYLQHLQKKNFSTHKPSKEAQEADNEDAHE